jgi:hypothetical protein
MLARTAVVYQTLVLVSLTHGVTVNWASRGYKGIVDTFV